MITNIEIYKKLKEAIQSEHYFITITSVDVEKKQLNHFYATEQFAKEDIYPTLEHFATQLIDEVRVAEGNT